MPRGVSVKLSPAFLGHLADVFTSVRQAGLSQSPTFRQDLTQVFATLQTASLSAVFVSDLASVHGALAVASDANLHFLAGRLDEWNSVTRRFVRSRLAEVPEDDPLRCPISLFRTMDYGRLETAHTRTLAWLMNPEGEHGFGSCLLEALLQRVSNRAGEVRVEHVASEFPISGSGETGRLDVLAEGTWEEEPRGGWILAVEAKVDAGEGKDQLTRYEAWLRNHAAGRTVYRVFLTPGRTPESATEEWEMLSYLELVRIFRVVYPKLRAAPGFHFLRFYLAGVLQDVCRLPRNVTEDAADPYSVASYLTTVHGSSVEGKS